MTADDVREVGAGETGSADGGTTAVLDAAPARKRATRTVKAKAAEGEAEPEAKPKRATRAKKTAEAETNGASPQLTLDSAAEAAPEPVSPKARTVRSRTAAAAAAAAEAAPAPTASAPAPAPSQPVVELPAPAAPQPAPAPLAAAPAPVPAVSAESRPPLNRTIGDEMPDSGGEAPIVTPAAFAGGGEATGEVASGELGLTEGFGEGRFERNPLRFRSGRSQRREFNTQQPMREMRGRTLRPGGQTFQNGGAFAGENAAPVERPAFQERPEQPERPERPAFQERPGFQERGNRPGFQDRQERQGFQERGDRPGFQDRQERQDRPGFQDRQERQSQQQGYNQQQQRRREYDIQQLDAMELGDLHRVAEELGIETPPLKKDDLIYAILEQQTVAAGNLLKKGILEILPDGKGFLRCNGYLSDEGDIYVSSSQIKRFNLKTGDTVMGVTRAPKDMERFHGLLRVEAINGLSTEVMKTRKEFEKLTPIFPQEKFKLETEQHNITARIIDLVSPIGKGQRGLIVAPPKAGKTSLIKSIANSIANNHPEVKLIVLLIDERPEEVTDISRSVRGEVVASTFDEMPDNHMRVADMVLEKAKRLVEMKHDVVILMDSITRLSRASNLVVTPSGRTLSGGLDPAAMYRPKRMFGAARNIEEGGSLTILATALVDTGSRMDEMIFEEFKGTGNMDLVLDRNLFDQRIFPAIDINKSGTRRDDLLMNREDLTTTFHLRRTLSALDNDKAINLLIDRLKNTKSNAEFMTIVGKSARNANATVPT